MLTKRQFECLKFIYQHIKHNGYSPSYRDIGVAMNLRSMSGVVRFIDELAERGFVRRLPGHARGLEVLKMPGANKEWLGTAFPPQLAMEIVRRAELANCAPEVVIIHALRAQFGQL
jgi:SOS-response transcriptional repressor LexA